MSTTHFRTCPLCEAVCGLKIEVDAGEVTSIKGDGLDTFSRGHICPKAAALADIHNDPDRLRRPVRRQGDEWTEISWDEAYGLVAEKLASVRKNHGSNAVGIYSGNPSVHNYATMTHSMQFLKLLKTKARFSATSVDQLPHQLIGFWMFGHQLLVPIPDIDHTHYMLMLGANPLASNGSLMTVPDVRNRLRDLQKRGGKLVVIDPRRTETAAMADQFHFIRPGTDAALLAALFITLFDEDLAKPGRLSKYLTGLEEAHRQFAAFTPERVAPVVGIEASAIRGMARELAAAKSASVYGRMGVSTQPFGALCQWLIQLLNIATGNLDRPGGTLFTKPALDTVGGPNTKPGHFGAWHSRVSGLPEFSGELPAAALAEELLTPGEGQIRAMVTVAGNPVLSTPNGSRLEEAFANLDFMVSIDFYRNETTRFADVILPPTGPLEHDHFDLIFNVFAVRNVARYSKPVFESDEGSRHDWVLFKELGERYAAEMGLEPMVLPPPQVLLDMGLKAGPYGEKSGHPLALDLKTLQDHPNGMDLGPLEPSLPQRLFTGDKRIKCDPPPLMADVARLNKQMFETPPPELVLIGRRHLRSNNSWMHNYKRLVKGKDRCTLMMNSEDGTRLNLQDGQTVKISSRVGSLQVTLAITADIKPGVVSLPHGWGHGRSGARLRVAGEHPGVSANDLTDERLLDELSGNAAVNGVPVTVAPA